MRTAAVQGPWDTLLFSPRSWCQVTPRFFKLQVPRDGGCDPQDIGMLSKKDEPQGNKGTLITREDMLRILVVEARGL